MLVTNILRLRGSVGRSGGERSGGRRLAFGYGATWAAGLLAALVLTTPAWWPWLHPNLDLWEVDDSKNHMIRLFHIGWLIERGVWFPRWIPEMFLGYGYPLLNYYAPALYYLAWLLGVALHLDVWDSFRAAGVATALLGAAGTYALTTAIWRRPAAGVIAALTVLYGPYVFQTNLFKRGDLPEALGLALIPWLLLAMWQLWQVDSHRRAVAWAVVAALAGAAEILSHNLTALLAAATAAVWGAALLIGRPRLDRLRLLTAAGATAAGLSAFFWLPAIGEMRLVHLEELAAKSDLDYRSWLVDPAGRSERQAVPYNRQSRTGLVETHLRYPHQLVAPPKISLAQAALGLCALAAVVAGAATHRRQRRGAGGAAQGSGRLGSDTSAAAARAPAASGAPAGPVAPVAALLVVSVVCWALTFTTAEAAWRVVPGLTLLQFPWRLLGPLGVCLAVAGAGALALFAGALERRGRWAGLAGWALLLAAGGGVVFNSTGDREVPLRPDVPRAVDARAVVEDEARDSLGAGTTSNREFLPRGVYIATYTEGFPRGRPVIERLYPDLDWLGGWFLPVDGDLRLIGWRTAPLRFSLRVANGAAVDGHLAIRQVGFPGWRAWIDGRQVALQTTAYIPEQQVNLSLLLVAVPPGEHTVEVAFGPSPPRLAGMGLTLVTVLGAAGALARWLRHEGAADRRTLAGLWLLVVLLAGYATWRGVRPALPPATFAGAAWPVEGEAPDLGRAPAAPAGTVVNLAEAARKGLARVESPTGASLGAGRYVDVRSLTVADADRERGAAGTSRRQWLYLHPPAAVSVDVALPPGRESWLEAALALDPAVWEVAAGDGVRFQATVTPLPAGGEETLVLDRRLNPRATTGDRRWVPVAVDLSRWAGQTVRLRLRTLPVDDLSFDWAGWANPVVVVRDSARARQP